jgi:inosose dehydratase
MSVQLCCSTVTFRNDPLPVALEEISVLGFDAIDLVSVPGYCHHFDAVTATPEHREDVVRQLKRHRLSAVAVTCSPGHFNQPGADEDEIVKAAMAYVELAARLGVPAINVGCGMPIEDRSTFREHAAKQASGLARIAAMSEYFGIGLNMEAPHRRGLCQTLDEAEYLLNAIGTENVRVVLDVAHVHASGATPESAIARFAGRIGHVHVRERRMETPGKDIEISLLQFFSDLQRSGYDGWCALGSDPGEDPAAVRRENLRASLEGILPYISVSRGLARHA